MRLAFLTAKILTNSNFLVQRWKLPFQLAASPAYHTLGFRLIFVHWSYMLLSDLDNTIFKSLLYLTSNSCEFSIINRVSSFTICRFSLFSFLGFLFSFGFFLVGIAAVTRTWLERWWLQLWIDFVIFDLSLYLYCRILKKDFGLVKPKARATYHYGIYFFVTVNNVVH